MHYPVKAGCVRLRYLLCVGRQKVLQSKFIVVRSVRLLLTHKLLSNLSPSKEVPSYSSQHFFFQGKAVPNALKRRWPFHLAFANFRADVPYNLFASFIIPSRYSITMPAPYRSGYASVLPYSSALSKVAPCTPYVSSLMAVGGFCSFMRWGVNKNTPASFRCSVKSTHVLSSVLFIASD